MVLSLYVCGKYMKQRHMALLFASNALVTCAVTFWYERSKSPMVTPKTHGAVTPLAFMSAAMAIAPGYCLLNLRPLPFFLIPAVFLMYECYEYQHFYVNEVCRPAHIAAMIYGLMFGLVFKKIALWWKWKVGNTMMVNNFWWKKVWVYMFVCRREPWRRNR